MGLGRGSVGPNCTPAWALALAVGPADPLGKCPPSVATALWENSGNEVIGQHGLTSSRHLQTSRQEKAAHPARMQQRVLRSSILVTETGGCGPCQTALTNTRMHMWSPLQSRLTPMSLGCVATR